MIYSDNPEQQKILHLMESFFALVEEQGLVGEPNIVVAALCALLASQIRFTVKNDIKAQDERITDYAECIKKTLIYNGARSEDHLA